MTIFLIVVGVIVAALLALAIYDLTQTRHAVLRNYPIIGHLRYFLEGLGPELRQYIITANDAERPFSRDQRRCCLLYTSDAADERSSVDLGGRRIIKKKTTIDTHQSRSITTYTQTYQ